MKVIGWRGPQRHTQAGLAYYGHGRYFTFTEEDARWWSDRPRQFEVEVRNPLRITSRQQDEALRRRAAEETGVGWLPQGQIGFPGSTEKGEKALGEWFRDQGYDSVFVEHESAGGGRQFVVFNDSAIKALEEIAPPAATEQEAKRALQMMNEQIKHANWLYSDWEPPDASVDEDQGFLDWSADRKTIRLFEEGFETVVAYLTGERIKADLDKALPRMFSKPLAVEMPAYGRRGEGGTLRYVAVGWGSWELDGNPPEEVSRRWSQLGVASPRRVASRFLKARRVPLDIGTVLYHGGPTAFDVRRTGTFYTDNPEYARKFAEQHGGKVFRVKIVREPTVYPRVLWWQDFYRMPSSAFRGYDVVRVQEPLQDLDDIDPESIVVVNPDVVDRI